MKKVKMTMNSSSSSSSSHHNHSSIHLFIIYGLVVLYALCYQLQIPLEPFLVDKLLKSSKSDNVDENTTNDAAQLESEAASTYATFKSCFSLAQSIGSLIFGFILDKWGVRIGLIINFLSCALCYYILSITNSISILYISRIPGLFMAGFLAAQTAIIKLTPVGPERLKALGRLTSAYTVGGIIGPTLGGQLGSTGDYFIGAKFATVGSLVAAGLVFLLPSSMDNNISSKQKEESSTLPSNNDDDDYNENEKKHHQPREKTMKEKEDQQSGESKEHPPPSTTTWIERLFLILDMVWIYLFVKIITSIANSMAKSAQPLILKRLGIDEAKMGMVMSAQFAFGGFANAFLLGPITKLMGGVVSLVVGRCIIIMGVAYCIQSVLYYNTNSETTTTTGHNSHLQYPFIGMIMLLSIFQYSLGTSITTKTSSIVPKHMQGTLMGMEHALFAIAYMAGPQLGVAGLQSGGISGLSAMCSCIFGVVFLVWTIFENKRNDIPSSSSSLSSSSSAAETKDEIELKSDFVSLLQKSTPSFEST